MIKVTITRKYENGELIEEVEVSEDDNAYAPTYPVYPTYPTYPICPTIKPWWQEPWTVTYSESSPIYTNEKPNTEESNK